MGAAFVNHWLTSTVGWAIAAGILAINASDVYEFAANEVAGNHWVLGVLIAVVVLYLTFVLYLTIGPTRQAFHLQKLPQCPSACCSCNVGI